MDLTNDAQLAAMQGLIDRLGAAVGTAVSTFHLRLSRECTPGGDPGAASGDCRVWWVGAARNGSDPSLVAHEPSVRRIVARYEWKVAGDVSGSFDSHKPLSAFSETDLSTSAGSQGRKAVSPPSFPSPSALCAVLDSRVLF